MTQRRECNVDDLDVGSIVLANLSIGKHPAIVLSTKGEIQDDGWVLADGTISLAEDRIKVPAKLGMSKECFVQCDVVETLSRNKVTSKHRKAYGPFLEQVRKQVKAAIERAKKSTQS